MQHNHPLIAYAYHFLCEAIIIFLIALPFFYHRFFFVPYWSYLIVIAVASLVFTLITKYKGPLFLYIIVTPFIFLAFYLLDYPIIMAFLIAIILDWRYIDIRNQDRVRREALYILITSILTVIVSTLVHDSHIMIYPFLLFIILCVGYIISHFVFVSKKEKKQINKNLLAYFAGILAIGAGACFLLFDVVRNVTVNLWRFFIDTVGSVILGVSNFLSFITVEKRGWPDQTPEEAKHGDGYWDELQEYNVIKEMSGLVILAVICVVLFVLTILIILLAKKRIQKRLHRFESREVTPVSTIENIIEERPDNAKKSIFKRFLKPPENPIRKMVYQFERKAEKHKKGRMPNETIEDWFKRIGMRADISVYQRVRYGDADVSESERIELKDQLKLMEGTLTSKG